MPKQFFKYKLLLDENMPGRHEFSILNEYFDVKHIRDDKHREGISDKNVYLLAVPEKRIIITRNIKHFIPLVGTKDDAGIIGIPPHWKPEAIDKKLMAFLSKTKPKALCGKYVTLT